MLLEPVSPVPPKKPAHLNRVGSTNWSPQEDAVLKANVKFGRKRCVNELLRAGFNRTNQAVGSRIRSLGIAVAGGRPSGWDERYSEELRLLFGTMSAKAIAARIGAKFGDKNITASIITHRARKETLLRSLADIRWAEVEIELVKSLAGEGCTDRAISDGLRARGFPRSPHAVLHLRVRQNIPTGRRQTKRRRVRPHDPYLEMDKKFCAAMRAAPECPRP